MIVATAGHVDHGKTSLVLALTGIDTDRLPEEKRRGLTIDLGFAYQTMAAGATVGFVDVPGHERFIHNMLAGVGGIDVALLVVAADDGPMPQTREHLAILGLLGVKVGLVALTKIDRVDRERAESVRAEITALLTASALAGARIFPLSNVTGEGIPALSAALAVLAKTYAKRSGAGRFRMSVDRIFTIAGAGRVVTGTIHAGRVAVGAMVRAQLAEATVRVRSLHAQNAAAEAAQAGERCALNIVGSTREIDRIARGDWITDVTAAAPVTKLDGVLHVLAGESRPLAHWTPVHVHLGAANVTGRVAILEGRVIAPGDQGLVQLVLDRALSAVYGDRFVVRDQSAQRTLGGGHVIDIFAPVRGRAKPARIALLRALDQSDHAAALGAAQSLAASAIDIAKFVAGRNADAASLHIAAPVKEVRAAPAMGLVDPADAALWTRVHAALRGAADRPPSVAELGKTLAVDVRVLRGVLERASKQSLLRRVAEGRYFLPERLDALAHVAEGLGSVDHKQTFTAAQFRDASGLGRNLTIEVLEFFDRIMFTRRAGDVRTVTRSAAKLFSK